MMMMIVIRQLSPGEVNNGEYIPRCDEGRGIYPPLFTDP